MDIYKVFVKISAEVEQRCLSCHKTHILHSHQEREFTWNSNRIHETSNKRLKDNTGENLCLRRAWR